MLSRLADFLSVFLLFIGASFYVNISLRLQVFCLLVVLANLSFLAKWLGRQTSLGTPFCGKEIISTKPRPTRAYDFFIFVYCVIVFNVFVLSPGPTWLFDTPMARCSLFVLKVPLNANKPTSHIHSLSQWPCMTYKTKTDFFLVWDRSCPWGTGIRGPMRGMATLPQGNQELLVVRDKVGRPQGSLG